MSTTVAIQKIPNFDDINKVKENLYTLLENIAPYVSLKEASTVLVKVNICFVKGPETGITVDPKLVYWFCEWLCNRFKIERIYVAESDATHLNADIAFKVLGWRQMFSNLPMVTLLNLSQDKRKKIGLNGLYFKDLEISETMLSSDLLISFAKLKTHDIQGISCVMKNQFGALPEKLKILYHPFLTEVIVDAVKIRPPDLCIVDGIIGHQGPGPVSGLPMPAGLLIAGTDAVATDHACAHLMRINPDKVPHIRLAGKINLGTTNYKVIGVPIFEARERFMTIPLWKKYVKFISDKVEARKVRGTKWKNEKA